MIRIMFLMACFLCIGCQEKKPYTGKCTIEKIDGQVTFVKLVLPNRFGEQSATFDLSSREDMDKFIAGMEMLLIDLKQSREQMTIGK